MIQAQSSQRQVRKKYEKVNGCTHPPSFMQILGISLMTTIIVLQANIITAISAISNPILITFTALSYAILLIIVYDYVKLVIIDPVDPRVLNQVFQEHQRDKALLVWCDTCKVDVHKYSYHCKRCDRCVEEFDHHCKYVNNCIGKQNYMNFFRLVISLIFLLLLELAQGLWVLISSGEKQKWIGLALVILSSLIVPLLVYLAVFHCYISFFEYGTTLRYLKGEVNIHNSHTEKRLSEGDGNLIVLRSDSREQKEQKQIEIPEIPEVNIQSATNLKKNYYLF